MPWTLFWTSATILGSTSHATTCRNQRSQRGFTHKSLGKKPKSEYKFQNWISDHEQVSQHHQCMLLTNIHYVIYKSIPQCLLVILFTWQFYVKQLSITHIISATAFYNTVFFLLTIRTHFIILQNNVNITSEHCKRRKYCFEITSPSLHPTTV